MPQAVWEDAVLYEIADTGFGRVTAAEVHAVIDYIKGFGFPHLLYPRVTNDPDMFWVWEKLQSDDPTNGWAAISPDEIRLFAMYVIEGIHG